MASSRENSRFVILSFHPSLKAQLSLEEELKVCDDCRNMNYPKVYFEIPQNLHTVRDVKEKIAREHKVNVDFRLLVNGVLLLKELPVTVFDTIEDSFVSVLPLDDPAFVSVGLSGSSSSSGEEQNEDPSKNLHMDVARSSTNVVGTERDAMFVVYKTKSRFPEFAVQGKKICISGDGSETRSNSWTLAVDGGEVPSDIAAKLSEMMTLFQIKADEPVVASHSTTADNMQETGTSSTSSARDSNNFESEGDTGVAVAREVNNELSVGSNIFPNDNMKTSAAALGTSDSSVIYSGNNKMGKSFSCSTQMTKQSGSLPVSLQDETDIHELSTVEEQPEEVDSENMHQLNRSNSTGTSNETEQITEMEAEVSSVKRKTFPASFTGTDPKRLKFTDGEENCQALLAGLNHNKSTNVGENSFHDSRAELEMVRTSTPIQEQWADTPRKIEKPLGLVGVFTAKTAAKPEA